MQKAIFSLVILFYFSFNKEDLKKRNCNKCKLLSLGFFHSDNSINALKAKTSSGKFDVQDLRTF